ncbi:MAG: type II toxin-antitoxin system RelE/ParE family toxin [Magnetococcales bacterium]|nr:type II toxin-antitoxin system RelE/ParE family toxin [Magnetococcales bacterium]
MEPMKNIKILEYLTKDGKGPFLSWLEGLRDIRAKARIRTRLDRVSMGNLGDHKTVGEGVIELRITYGPGYRVYLGRDGEQLVLLLCGGDKSTQTRDITKAHEYWADYRSRKNAIN